MVIFQYLKWYVFIWPISTFNNSYHVFLLFLPTWKFLGITDSNSSLFSPFLGSVLIMFLWLHGEPKNHDLYGTIINVLFSELWSVASNIKKDNFGLMYSYSLAGLWDKASTIWLHWGPKTCISSVVFRHIYLDDYVTFFFGFFRHLKYTLKGNWFYALTWLSCIAQVFDQHDWRCSCYFLRCN